MFSSISSLEHFFCFMLIAELEDAKNHAEQNEAMQMYWICFEADLSEILQRGLVPETEAESGGKFKHI